MGFRGPRVKWFLAAVAVFALSEVQGIEATECDARSYKIGQRVLRHDGSVSTAFVSISPKGITIAGLVCVTETLKRDHPDWSNVVVLIFTDAHAARTFQPTPDDTTVDMQPVYKSLLAQYNLLQSIPAEVLELLPLGYGHASERERMYSSRIDFPTPRPMCRFAPAGRCLLRTDVITFPPDGLALQIEEVVNLLASIDSDGHVVGVELERPVPPDTPFEQAAIDSVKTWWLEAANASAQIPITFDFRIDAAVPHGQTAVEFEGNTVIVKANPVNTRIPD